MKTNSTRFLIAAICAIGLSVSLGARLLTAPTSAKTGMRVLYVTQSKGFRHASLHESEAIMEELGAANGFNVTVTQKVEKHITPENLKNLDVIVFYTTGELPLSDAQKKAFLDWIKSGKGFIGIHSATDTFYKWPEYGEMIGGYFDGHPWTQDVTVGVSAFDRKNPITGHWEESFKIQEEIYQYKQFNKENVTVTMKLDTANTDMTRKGIKATEFPLTWHRSYGKGRVFYTALGHRPELWRDQRYQKMIVNALKWASGQIK